MGVREENVEKYGHISTAYSTTHGVSGRRMAKSSTWVSLLSQCRVERTALWGQWNAHAEMYRHDWVGTKFSLWGRFQNNVFQYVSKETQKVNVMSNLTNVEKASVHSLVFLFSSWLTLSRAICWWLWVSFNVIAIGSSGAITHSSAFCSPSLAVSSNPFFLMAVPSTMNIFPLNVTSRALTKREL